MTENQWQLTELCAVAWLVAAVLTGCATNSLTVTETSGDYTFSMTQTTRSSWGSKTEEGSGAVSYSGDGFDFHAGSAVVGQQANEPVASLVELVKLLGGLAAGGTTETE